MFLKICPRFMSTLPSIQFQQNVKSGLIQSDAFQSEIIKHFDKVFVNFSQFRLSNFRKNTPKGLYVYGGVGRGKTMLMDIFYDCCQTHLKRKTHFNEFIVDIHLKMHSQSAKNATDRVKTVAADLITSARLLCFDEFQVTDIADAMILKRLFEELWSGCIIVMTSNSSPDDLYKNGLNREYFMPFIHLLKKKTDIVNLDSAIDYRSRDANALTYYLISGDKTDGKLNKLFKELTKSERSLPTTKTITLSSRKIVLKKTCGLVLDSSFEELCHQELGSADYLKIAETFHTVLLRNLPIIGLKFADPAQRFIKLIDILYLKRVRLAVSAETDPLGLFSSENLDADFIGWERTVSRLHEMTTEQYWKLNS